MDVITGNPSFAREVLGTPATTPPALIRDSGDTRAFGFERALHDNAADGGDAPVLLRGALALPGRWRTLHVVAEPRTSQYDLLIERMRDPGDVPDRVLVLGGWGESFHGQHGRSWVGLRGNLHLSAHVALDHPLDAIGMGLHALAAVSLVEAIDELPGLEGRAAIKWVNDVYLGEAKVAGFLAHAASRAGRVRGVVFGMGVNVARAPAIAPDDRIVRRATALTDHVRDGCATLADFLPRLAGRLDANLLQLVERGPAPLIDAYRARSMVVGRRVRVHTDPLDGPGSPGVEGTVTAIGDDLALHLKGVDGPVREGRLELLDDGSPS